MVLRFFTVLLLVSVLALVSSVLAFDNCYEQNFKNMKFAWTINTDTVDMAIRCPKAAAGGWCAMGLRDIPTIPSGQAHMKDALLTMGFAKDSNFTQFTCTDYSATADAKPDPLATNKYSSCILAVDKDGAPVLYVSRPKSSFAFKDSQQQLLGAYNANNKPSSATNFVQHTDAEHAGIKFLAAKGTYKCATDIAAAPTPSHSNGTTPGGSTGGGTGGGQTGGDGSGDGKSSQNPSAAVFSLESIVVCFILLLVSLGILAVRFQSKF